MTRSRGVWWENEHNICLGFGSTLVDEIQNLRVAVFDYRGGEVEAVLGWKSPAAFTRPMDRFTVGEAPPLALAVGLETVFNGFNLERDRERERNSGFS